MIALLIADFGAGGGFWRVDAWLFSLSLGAIAAVWLGYPLALAATGRRRAQPAAAARRSWPRLSLIISACNEAAVIERRLRNALDSAYPAGRLEVLLCEDGSEDETALRARRVHDPRLRILPSPERRGKAAAINRGAAEATGEILVFSDANNLYSPASLRHLATAFDDPGVGAAAGLKSVAAAHGVGGGESIYWRYERWIMELEHRSGTLVNAPGEILAIRRACFRPLPEGVLLNDDLYLVWQVLAQRLRVALVPAARSWELPAASAREEWRRRSRIAGGHWQAVRLLRSDFRRMTAAAWIKLLCHQILRPLSPAVMLLALLCGSLLLLPHAGTAASLKILAIAQTAAYGAVVLAIALRALGLRLGWLEAPYFFCLAQAAALQGALRSARGVSPLWAKPPRAGATPPPALHKKYEKSGTAEKAVDARAVVGGLAWAGSSFLGGKLIVFGSIVILARLLSARDFGSVTIVLTAIAVLEVFGRFGLNAALIFENRETAAAADLLFWTTLATATLETGIAWAVAPFVARFFHEPLIAPMLRALAPALILTALGGTHDTLLRRTLAFRQKLLPDLAMASSKGVASVIFALLGYRAWSLIWGQWIGLAAATFFLWNVVPWRPGWRCTKALAAQMFRYAKHVYAMDASGAILVNLDYLATGRILGDSLLGFYMLAFRIPEALLISVLNVVTGVVFPAFSRMQHDWAGLCQALLQTLRYTSLFGLPLAAGMFLLSRDLIVGLYGSRWLPAVPALRVLAIYAAIRCTSHHFGDAYKAIGRPDILSALTLVWWLLLPPSLIAGARWGGIVGVAWAQVGVRSCMTALHFYLIVHVVKVSPRALWMAYVPALEATLGMSVALLMARHLAANFDPRVALVLLTLWGTLAYLLILFLRHKSLLVSAWRILAALAAPRLAAAPDGAKS